MNNNSLLPQVRINSSKEVLTKLKILLGVKSAKELAGILHLKPNTISSWKKRNTLCYTKLIEVCKQHNIDLNELFLADYSKKPIDKNYIGIPIIYIDDYLEYYLSIEGKHQKLKKIYYPKQVCFDIIIQLYGTSEEQKDSRLLYACCKKVDLSAVEVAYSYAFLLVQKGFQRYKLIKIDQEKKRLYVQKDSDEITELNTDEIIEIFQCIKYFPC
ncbi:helix-turn-helix domain-containing protein [Myroides sp. DW712]|uniref:helix-turn-helix domain-containing protein n=1 Tax=Myroides sp. DW712 TaxID=3389800 RepID=UPI00397927BC